MTTPTRIVARIAKRAMFIHENSYDTSSETYETSFQEACDEAANEVGEPLLGRLVYLAGERWWNDVQTWSEAVLADDQAGA